MTTIREVSYQLLRRHGITTIFRDRAPSLCEPSRGSWHRQRDGDFVNAWSSHRPLVGSKSALWWVEATIASC